LDVNNTYVNPTFTSNPAVPGSQGNLVPYISQEIGNAAADFDWKKFTLEISGTTHSKEYTTATNTDTVNGVQGSWDPYTTFNFKTSYHFANGSIFFGVDNFTNQRYYQIYENVGTVFGVGAHLFI
jgi:iron complex outermembrane receptor protein